MVQDVRHDSRVNVAGQVFDVNAKVEVWQFSLFTGGLELCAHCISGACLYWFNHVQFECFVWLDDRKLYFLFSSLPVFKFNNQSRK